MAYSRLRNMAKAFMPLTSEKTNRMDKRNTKKADKRPEDRENPEWTRADFARAVPMSGLPSELQVAVHPQTSPQTNILVLAAFPERRFKR
jgi:hypothetical protein